MSICKWFLGILACVALASQSWGQVANSPFSQFGLGETYSSALANTQGMAGIGVSQPQYYYINNQNPALLVFNGYASFQAGILGETRTINSNSGHEKYKGGNMNYLIMAFPVKPGKWVTSLGLMPYSTMKYKVQTIKPVEGKLEDIRVDKEGAGGLTQLYWSNGIRINKDFSVGVKATYLFGSVNRIEKFYQELILVNENKSYLRTQLKELMLNLGGSYSKDSLWGNNYRLSIGAVYGLGGNIRTFLQNKQSGLTLAGDTAYSQQGQSIGDYTHLPSSLTLGISLSNKSKWAIGTEFTYQDWSSFKTPYKSGGQTLNGNFDNLGKSWKTSLGGEFTPDADAVEGFLNRVTYRLGATYEKYPFLVSDKQVKDYGINFGFSIPTGRSSLDLAFKVGKRGNKAENILEESYFKVYLGLTFNDIWFIKRKFD